MRALVLALLALAAVSARAELIYEHNGLTIRLLGSACASEDAQKAIAKRYPKTAAKRADVMRFGVFIPACYALDADGDVIVIDRKGFGGVIYRKLFTGTAGV